jgi:hypothetical protein
MPCLLLGPFSPGGGAEPGTLSGVSAHRIDRGQVASVQSLID